jgi:hypothetical protein
MFIRTRFSLIAALAIFYGNALAAPPPLQWLGLFHWDLIAWLDNPRRLHEICPDSLGERARCEQQARAAKIENLRLYREPSSDAETVGTLIIIALPGKGLFHAFKALGEKAQRFSPDLYDQDWGYGPYYHQTVQARRDDWFQLPPQPFAQAVWLNARPLFNANGVPPLENVNLDTVYLLNNDSVVFTNLGENSVSMRLEQPADMPCDKDEEKETPDVPEQTRPYSDLFDEYGHLKLKIKYMRGC